MVARWHVGTRINDLLTISVSRVRIFELSFLWDDQLSTGGTDCNYRGRQGVGAVVVTGWQEMEAEVENNKLYWWRWWWRWWRYIVYCNTVYWSHLSPRHGSDRMWGTVLPGKYRVNCPNLEWKLLSIQSVPGTELTHSVDKVGIAWPYYDDTYYL